MATPDPVESKLGIDIEVGIDAVTKHPIEISAVGGQAASAATTASPTPSPVRRRRRRRSSQGQGQSAWTPTAGKFVVVTAAFAALTVLLYVLVHWVL